MLTVISLSLAVREFLDNHSDVGYAAGAKYYKVNDNYYIETKKEDIFFVVTSDVIRR